MLRCIRSAASAEPESPDIARPCPMQFAINLPVASGEDQMKLPWF
jgi:hypothetical protein